MLANLQHYGFQSTHPARGATRPRLATPATPSNFNPRTPRGVRLTSPDHIIPFFIISIHAPREGCDDNGCVFGDTPKISIHAPREGCDLEVGKVVRLNEFQSTHPARGATASSTEKDPSVAISIHAPREGCDRSYSRLLIPHKPFQSTHPARGATSHVHTVSHIIIQFQSTHPARGATRW